jgi:hypothetical protein
MRRGVPIGTVIAPRTEGAQTFAQMAAALRVEKDDRTGCDRLWRSPTIARHRYDWRTASAGHHGHEHRLCDHAASGQHLTSRPMLAQARRQLGARSQPSGLDQRRQAFARTEVRRRVGRGVTQRWQRHSRALNVLK